MGRRNNGLSEQWAVGIMGCRNNGSSELWAVGIMTRNRFNPPFSKNFSTNIGRTFLNLLDTHFPKDNKLHKIFNRNNVKISYSCMDNMTNIINTHNKLVLKTGEKQKKIFATVINRRTVH